MRNVVGRRFEHWRYRYQPRIADWLTALSTRAAQKKLARHEPIKLLVDTTVFYHAVTHESAWIKTGESRWGGFEARGTGYLARVPVHSGHTNRHIYNDVTYLAGIAFLNSIGLVSLYTSAELEDEKFRQPAGRYRGYGYYDYNLLAAKLPTIDGSVFPTMGPSFLGLPSAEEQQRDRILGYDDELFKKVIKWMGDKNSQDVWHLVTTERNQFFGFLTMDYKFVRNYNSQSRHFEKENISAKVLTPSALGEYLGLFPVNPNIFAYNNASFPVRADLAIPGDHRRPPSSYRK